MASPDDPPPAPPSPTAPDTRRPYEKPQIVCEELFEVMALSCGKLESHPNQGSCITVPRVS